MTGDVMREMTGVPGGGFGLWVVLLAGSGCAVRSVLAWWAGRGRTRRAWRLVPPGVHGRKCLRGPGDRRNPSVLRRLDRRWDLAGFRSGGFRSGALRSPGAPRYSGGRRGQDGPRGRGRPWRDGAAALGAAGLTVTVIGGPVGWTAAGAAACAVWRLLRARDRSGGPGRATETRAAVRQLPLAAELLAACLAAGSSPGRAAEAVGRSLGGPLGLRLLRAATELRLGGEPGVVWQRFGALPGSEGLARCMERAATAGVPAVDAVTRLASELRAGRSRAAAARARRAAVLVTGPLGLCFLPAFLAIGVAPVVMGLADSLT